MNVWEILKVIFLGIVEGITEWLPISSTGHMLLVDEFIQLNMSEEFKEMFFILIQLGAIIAVILLFWNKMFPFQWKDKSKPFIIKDTFSIWFKVVVACARAAFRMKQEGFTGCKTIFDIPPAYLCSISDEDLRAHLL